MRKPVLAICEQQKCSSACAALVSVAEQAGFSLTWPETPKTGFLVTWLKLYKQILDNIALADLKIKQ